MNARKTSITMMILSVVSFFLVGNGLLAACLLKKLQAPYAVEKPVIWGARNAIILLGFGTVKLPQTNEVRPTLLSYGRITKTAEMYFACKQQAQRVCTVIASGADVLKTGQTEAAVYANVLIKLGVAQQDILQEGRSMNTYQNAQFVQPIIQQGKFDRVLLVTSGIHLKRSLLYFSAFHLMPIPIAADYINTQVTKLPSGYHFALSDFSVHEYIGIARFYMYSMLGLNQKTSTVSILMPTQL